MGTRTEELCSPSASKYSQYAHSAVFPEIKMDEQIGLIRVTHVVSAVAAGRILNRKFASG
jgi:xanthine dehydrogenase YagR molybdenum-binding subunit